MLTKQCLEKGRLAGPVRPDQAEDVPSMKGAGEPRDEDALPDVHLHVTRTHDDIATAVPRVEPQRHRILILGGRTQARQALESLPTPLGLLRVLSGDVARDVIRFGGDLLLLLLVRPLLREAPFGALDDKTLV